MVLEFDKKKRQVHEESDKMSFKAIVDNTPIPEKLSGLFSALHLRAVVICRIFDSTIQHIFNTKISYICFER